MKRALILLFIIELIAGHYINHYISIWLILWACVLALFIGIGLIKNSIVILMPALQQLQGKFMGSVAANQQSLLVKAACHFLAGVLFIFPGLVSDGLALLLLLPPIHLLLRKSILTILKNKQNSFSFGGGAFGTFTAKDSAFSNPLEDVFEKAFKQAGAENPFINPHNVTQGSHHQGNIIEGEAREIVEDVKQLK